jgi:hypothetical protein
MLGALPRTRYSRKVLWYVVGRNCIKLATCKTAWPQQVIGKLKLCNNGLIINLILFIRDSAKPFLGAHIWHQMLHFNSLSHTIVIECPWRKFCNIIQSYRLKSILRVICFQSYNLCHKFSKFMVVCRQKTHMWPPRRCIN